MILARLKTWLAAAGAVVIAIASALIYGWFRGKRQVEQAQDAKQADVIEHATEVRNDVERTTHALPDAPAQPVADADPDTAAGQLREHWSR